MSAGGKSKMPAFFSTVFLIFVMPTLFAFSIGVPEENALGVYKRNIPKTLLQSNAIEVKGVVRDENGVPLPNASITVKGTKLGTVADAQGNFSITVPSEKSILLIEHSGYESYEIRVGSKRSIEVSLNLDQKSSSMDSVIVIGYGTARKTDLPAL